ncbi:hypothetical protein MASR1M107_08370 [Ignavibacteriales bacterium]
MDTIFTREELAEKLGISKRILAEWEKEDLVRHSGISDEGAELYTVYQLEICQHLKKLTELGYGIDAIKKIIKKVGLPKFSAENGRHSLNVTYLTVGQLAENVKVSPRTIKHWEEMGIIEPEMRSEGGYRLYAPNYIFICNLIKDLQLFGYSLEEIKRVADKFKVFLGLTKNLETHPFEEAETQLEELLVALDGLFAKMELFKEGIARWEDILRKKRKEIVSLKQRNSKRATDSKGKI